MTILKIEPVKRFAAVVGDVPHRDSLTKNTNESISLNLRMIKIEQNLKSQTMFNCLVDTHRHDQVVPTTHSLTT